MQSNKLDFITWTLILIAAGCTVILGIVGLFFLIF